MTKKPSKPSEFATMEKLAEILRPFDRATRIRILNVVDAALEANAPKPRKQRSDAGKNKALSVKHGLPPAPPREEYEALPKVGH
jgi:hypothetical protein